MKLPRFALRLMLVGVFLALYSGCTREAKKSSYIAEADKYFQAGEYPRAEIEYKNAIQLGGLDAHAIGRLGIIYFEQGRVVRASSYLRKANELAPNNLEVRLKLGYLYLATGRLNDARDAAIFILDREPKHAEAPILLAEALAQPKDATDARTRLQALPTAGTAPVVSALGLLDLRERKYQEAEARFEQARQLDAKYVAVHSMFARLYWTQKDLPRAEKSFATALASSPARSPVRLQYLQFNLQTGKVEAAKKILEEMIHTSPDFITSYVLLASIAMSENRAGDSIPLLEKALAQDPENPEALLLMGKARLATNDPKKAIAILQKASSLFPQAAEVHYQLGAALLADGDLDAASNSLGQALKISPGLPAAVLDLARINLQKKNPAPAIASLKTLLLQKPDNGAAQLLLADAHRLQGEFQSALEIYQKLAVSNPQKPELHFFVGSVLLELNRRNDARRAFVRALDVSSSFLPALEQLLRLDIAEKQFGPAQTRLENYISKTPENPNLHIALARLHLAQKNFDKAEPILQKAVELQPESPAAYLLLAELYMASDQWKKALPALQASIAKNPKDVKSIMLLGTLQEQQKDYPAAKESYEKLLAINPRAPAALNNLAYIYLEHLNDLDKAHDLAQRARELLPNQGETADTLGWVLYRKRQYPRALLLLEDAAAKLPENPEVQFHLGMAQYMMGEEKLAQAALRRALRLKPDFHGAAEAQQSLSILELDIKSNSRALAILEKAVNERKDDGVALCRLGAVYETHGESAKALTAYESALRANAQNIPAALNVIRLYRSRGDTNKAIELARTLRNAAPNDGRVAHVLGRLAFETGDHQWSVGLLQEAARKQADDPEVQLDYARASYSLGHVDAARDVLANLRGAPSSFPRAAEAQQFLELIEIAGEPSKADAKINTITNALKADASNVPALIAKGASDEKNGDWKLAIQSYEKVLARYPSFAPAKKRLALLYSSHSEDNKKAVEFATKAREAYSSDPEVAKALGIALFREGSYSRAATLLQESARVRSQDAEVMYYLGLVQRELKDKAASDRSLQRALELGLSERLATNAREALGLKK